MMMIDDDDDDGHKTNTAAIRITQPDNRKHISPAHHKQTKQTGGWTTQNEQPKQKHIHRANKTQNSTPPQTNKQTHKNTLKRIPHRSWGKHFAY